LSSLALQPRDTFDGAAAVAAEQAITDASHPANPPDA
jgi:hypothetical protein